MRPTKLLLLGVAAAALVLLPKRSSKKTKIQTGDQLDMDNDNSDAQAITALDVVIANHADDQQKTSNDDQQN